MVRRPLILPSWLAIGDSAKARTRRAAVRGRERQLAPVVLINAVGNGLFFAISALYFTRLVGVSASELGLGLTIGGICAAVVSVPVGRLAQRWGPRPVTITIWVLESAGLVGYTQVHSFGTFLPLVGVVVMLDRSAGAGYRVLLSQALVGENRAQARSHLRAIANVGMGAGATLAGVVLGVGNRAAFTSAIVADAATFLIAAILLHRLVLPTPATPEQGGNGEPGSKAVRSLVWRDGPFLAITFLSMVLTLQFGLLEVGLPLWVAGHTAAPHPTVAVALVINTAMVALLQVRLSKGTNDLRRAARLTGRAGLLLAVGCGVFALASGIAAWAAVIVVLIAAVLQTFAEMYFSVGTMSLSYDLVPENDSGAYHGVFQAGYIGGLLLAPIIITNTALRFGAAGWGALAALFAVSGLLVIPAGRWALTARQARSREADPAVASAPAPVTGEGTS
jgi:MFS family permease